MKIAVCIKQVVSRDSPLRLNDTSSWIRETETSWEVNEPDSFALEEALRLKEQHGGEVIVCSAGPARVQQVIREALAKGADRAIHVEYEVAAPLDPLFAARVMAEALRPESCDLICTGLQSDDLGFAQTGVAMAELLGLPHATIIMEVQVKDGGLRVKRELESGWFQWVHLPLPALLTIQSGINKPRYATLLGIKKAKTKEIRQVSVEDLGLRADARGGDLKLARIYVPVKTKKTNFLDGTAKEAAQKLAAHLRNDVRVI